MVDRRGSPAPGSLEFSLARGADRFGPSSADGAEAAAGARRNGFPVVGTAATTGGQRKLRVVGCGLRIEC